MEEIKPPQAPTTKLGKLVRMGLVAKGKSLKELAAHLEISYQNLFAILSGKTRLNMSTAKKIAVYLDLPIEDLAEAEGGGAKEETGGAKGTDPEQEDVVEQQYRYDQTRKAQMDRGLSYEPRGTEGSLGEPFQTLRERRQHVLLRSSQPAFPAGSARPSPSQYLQEREADQLLLQLLQLIDEDRVPGFFYRILAEKLKPYLADQSK